MIFRRAEITTAALIGVATGIGLLAVGASLVTGVTPCSLLASCDKPAATATTVSDTKPSCPLSDKQKAEAVAAKATECASGAEATTIANKSACTKPADAVAVSTKSECSKGAEAVALAAKSECSKGAEAVAVTAKSECSAAKSACTGEAVASANANYRLIAFRGGFFPVAVPATFAASTTPANLVSASTCTGKAATVAAKTECTDSKTGCSDAATTVAAKADCADKPDCCSDSCDDEKPAKTDDTASGPIASKTPAN